MVEELLRILKYNTLPYRELRRNKTLEPGGLLPSALPVVVYNGESPWAAATNIRELIAPTGPAPALRGSLAGGRTPLAANAFGPNNNV